jgi:hypothetical protein
MSNRTWTVAEAKARLSEIMRLASTEGPQRIGTQKRYVLVPEESWDALASNTPKVHRGQWLIDNMRDFEGVEFPDRSEPDRPPPDFE